MFICGSSDPPSVNVHRTVLLRSASPCAMLNAENCHMTSATSAADRTFSFSSTRFRGRANSAVWALRLSAHGISSRNSGKIEFALSHSKQTAETISNRNYSRGPRPVIRNPFLTSCRSLFKTQAHCGTFLRGAKENWRNSNYA